MDMRKASDRIHDTLPVTLDWEEPAPDPSGAAFIVFARQRQAARLSGNEPPTAFITPGEKHPQFSVALRYTGPLGLLFLGQHRHKWPVRIASLLVNHFQLSPSDPDWNDAAAALRGIRAYIVRGLPAHPKHRPDPFGGITLASVVRLSREAPCQFMGDGLPIVAKWKAVVEKAGMTWASLSPSVLHKADKVRLEYMVTLHDLFTLAKHGWPVSTSDIVQMLDPREDRSATDGWLLAKHIEDLRDFHGIAEGVKPRWKRLTMVAGTIPPLGAVFTGDVRFLDSGLRVESRESPVVMAVPVRFDELRGRLSDGDVETMLSAARGESKSGKYGRESKPVPETPKEPVIGAAHREKDSKFQEINDTLKALQATSPSRLSRYAVLEPLGDGDPPRDLDLVDLDTGFMLTFSHNSGYSGGDAHAAAACMRRMFRILQDDLLAVGIPPNAWSYRTTDYVVTAKGQLTVRQAWQLSLYRGWDIGGEQLAANPCFTPLGGKVSVGFADKWREWREAVLKEGFTPFAVPADPAVPATNRGSFMAKMRNSSATVVGERMMGGFEKAPWPASPVPKAPPAVPEPLKEGTGSPLAGAENKTCDASSGGREAVLKAAREIFPDVNIASDDRITPTGGGYWVSCRVFVPRLATDEVYDGPYVEFLPLGKERSEFNHEVRGTMDDGRRLRETGKAGS